MDETSSAAALGFAHALVAIAAYEYAALRWRKVPTITKLIKGLPVPLFWAVIAAGIAAWVDHFVTGWVL